MKLSPKPAVPCKWRVVSMRMLIAPSRVQGIGLRV